MTHTLERKLAQIFQAPLRCRYYNKLLSLSLFAGFFLSFRHFDSNRATSVILYEGPHRRNEFP